MATLQQLRTRTFDMLRETSSDSHFTPEQINGYLNQGQERIAVLASPPEDFIEVAVELNKGAYTLPSDDLVIQSVYFGTATTADDMAPLTATSKTLVRELFPNWLDETITNAGTPTHYLKLDNNTIYIHKRPDANNLKRLYIFYGYLPATMAADGDEPAISVAYHGLLPYFACRLAYYSLTNPVMAKEMYAAFLADYNSIKENVDKGIEENFRFKWAVNET